jgi:hypothetical protein
MRAYFFTAEGSMQRIDPITPTAVKKPVKDADIGLQFRRRGRGEQIHDPDHESSIPSSPQAKCVRPWLFTRVGSG